MPPAVNNRAPQNLIEGVDHHLLIVGNGFDDQAVIQVNGAGIETTTVTHFMLVGEVDGDLVTPPGQLQVTVVQGPDVVQVPPYNVVPVGATRSQIRVEVDGQINEFMDCLRNETDALRQQTFDDLVGAPDEEGVKSAGKAFKSGFKAVVSAVRDAVLRSAKNLRKLSKNMPPG